MPSIEEMYEGLITENDIDQFLGVKRSYDDDDAEDFMTSKELSKLQVQQEERGFGVTPSATEIEEEVHFKTYSKKRVHKYTESEMAKIREDCLVSIVHDYGENDIFHMSDEQRAENDMLAEMSAKLGSLKRTYRRVDQYIEAMRTVVAAWEMLEQKGNYIHTKDEFFRMVGEGRIVSSRIIMPKLKKFDQYNVDMLIKYISNPEMDPSDLVPKKESVRDEWYGFMEEEEEAFQEYYDSYLEEHEDDPDVDANARMYAHQKMEEDEYMRLLSMEEAEYIGANLDNPLPVRVKPIPGKYVKDYDRRRSFDRRSKRKKMNKAERMIDEDVKDILNVIQSNPSNRDVSSYTRSYFLTHSMFEPEKPFKDIWENLRFDGSWASDEDVYLLDLITMEEMMNQPVPRNPYLTYADNELTRFFSAAENNGINVTEIRRRMSIKDGESVTASTKRKNVIKENKKMEASILKRITALNNNPKFKKLVGKAEKALNKTYSE